jgi:hypothetical protein
MQTQPYFIRIRQQEAFISPWLNLAYSIYKILHKCLFGDALTLNQKHAKFSESVPIFSEKSVHRSKEGGLCTQK